MRLTGFDRLGLAGLLVVFAFVLSAHAQSEPSSFPGSKLPVDDMTRVGLRSGSELFEHQWKTTDPSRVGVLINEPRVPRRPDGFSDTATGRQQAKRIEQLEKRRAEIEKQRAALQASAPFIAHVQGRIGDGLGPLHNASSCADCHPRGGASGVEHNVTLITVDPRSLAVQVANAKHGEQLLELFPSLLGERGILSIETVVHDQSTNGGYDEIRNRLAGYVPGGIDDAWFIPASRTSDAIARQPVVAGRHRDIDFYLSQRNSPPLYGLGVIDRISNRRLVTLAKKQREESDGEISGRVALKFGWRGQIGSVAAFVSQACAGELGLTQTTTLQPGDPVNVTYQAPGVDMSPQDVMQLTSHVASISVPTERTPVDRTGRQVYQGESTFNAIGCASCHVPDVYPALNIFSDLLLHDMGEALQAPSPAPVGAIALAGRMRLQNYPSKGPISGSAPEYYSGFTAQAIPIAEVIEAPTQPQFPRGTRAGKGSYVAGSTVSVVGNTDDAGGATWDDLQREWRTPPLWGIADTAPYLHDGRASTLEEAIGWHSGEARSSRNKFDNLNESDKTNLLTFLRSLRAPADALRANE